MPIFPRTGPVTFGVPRKPRRAIDREQLETVEEHKAAQAAIEFATLRRQADETFNAALSQAAQAPDEESAAAFLRTAEQAVSKLQSKNVRVQNAFSAHLEGTMAGWTERFTRQWQGINKERSLNQAKVNIQAAIDRNDPVEAAKNYTFLAKIDPGNSPLYEQGIADIESDTLFASTSKDIDSEDPVLIQRGVETLKNAAIEGMSAKQVKRRSDLLDAGQAELESRQNDNYKAAHEPIWEMATATTELEFYKAGEKARETIEAAEKSGAITPQQALTLQDHWRAHKDRAARPDPGVEAQAWTRILDPTQDRADVDRWLWDHETELGTSLPDLVKANAAERNRRTDAATTQAANTENYNALAATSYAVAKYEMDSNDEADFRRMENYELRGKDLTAEEMTAKAAADAVTFMEARPPKPPTPPVGPFTELRIQETVGMAERGGYYIDPKTKEVFPFPSTGALRDFFLGRLGPDWHLVSPQALKIALRRGPLSFWHYQSDKEKAATLEKARNLKSAFWDGTVLEGDITEGDREVAVEIAPSGPITAKQVQAFEDYLEETGTLLPKPSPSPSAEVLAELGGEVAAAPEVPEAEELPEIPVVETDADFDALPSGTDFIAPDGTKRRKP